MGPSDADLVARVLADDDRRAFAELVRRHQSAVRNLLRRLTAGDGLAATIAVIALPGLVLGIQATLLAALPSLPPGALLAAGAAAVAAASGALCLALAE